MKERLLTLVAAGAAILAAGCVPMLSPIYTDDDVTFDPALLGIWLNSDNDGESWEFAQDGERAYRLVYTDAEGAQGAFEVHLAAVDGALFLDLFPGEPELEASDFYKMHLVPAHSFLVVDSIEPQLRMRTLEADWLEDFLEENPDALAHHEVDGSIVLTASTIELQRFVLAHLDTEGAFSDATTLRRVSP